MSLILSPNIKHGTDITVEIEIIPSSLSWLTSVRLMRKTCNRCGCCLYKRAAASWIQSQLPLSGSLHAISHKIFQADLHSKGLQCKLIWSFMLQRSWMANIMFALQWLCLTQNTFVTGSELGGAAPQGQRQRLSKSVQSGQGWRAAWLYAHLPCSN